MRGPGERLDEPFAQAGEPRVRGRRRSGRVRPQLFDLTLQRPAPRLELEPDRLCGLAREPQLTPVGVVSEALRRDGGN